MVRSERSSSSDEDERYNAALLSVAIDSNAVRQFATPSVQTSGRKSLPSKISTKRSANVLHDDYDGNDTDGLKLYQTRVQDLLHKHLDKFFEESLEEVPVQSEDAAMSSDQFIEDKNYDREIRLYSNARLGVALKKSNPLKGCSVKLHRAHNDSGDEDSAEQEYRLQSAAIAGSTLKSQADAAKTKAFTRLLAAEEAMQRIEKAELERVAHLKQERGEEWLPSIAKEIIKDVRIDTEKRKSMSSEGKIGVVAKYRI